MILISRAANGSYSSMASRIMRTARSCISHSVSQDGFVQALNCASQSRGMSGVSCTEFRAGTYILARKFSSAFERRRCPIMVFWLFTGEEFPVNDLVQTGS